ncbi:MAG: PIG-L family deacetylase, partial [Bacteroidota bacterium]
VQMEEVASYCEQYEKQINLAGGIDIQLLGIGRTGHIGFNEPGAWETSPTRMVRLDHLTRHDAIKDFQSEDDVPYRAITMGVGSIFKARTVYLMAWGQHKASIVQQAVEGEISTLVPATFLQKHPNVKVVLDRSASEELTRMSAPWLAGICNWNDDLICKAVVWLSQTTGKPILKLTDEDYNEHGLSDLIIEQANSYELNIRIFNRLQRTITGWPGGKPHADDTSRPERAKPAKKRVILFSPHPDDDVISMGGTFQRLVDQGHEVHVAYQTSGNIAVHDYDALRYAEFVLEFGQVHQTMPEEEIKRFKKIIQFLNKKNDSSEDIPEVRSIKGLIRRGEARAGARFTGLPDERIHFL